LTLLEDEVRSDWTDPTDQCPALWRAAGEPDVEYHRKRPAMLTRVNRTYARPSVIDAG
jgi:hypothetical protein